MHSSTTWVIPKVYTQPKQFTLFYPTTSIEVYKFSSSVRTTAISLIPSTSRVILADSSLHHLSSDHVHTSLLLSTVHPSDMLVDTGRVFSNVGTVTATESRLLSTLVSRMTVEAVVDAESSGTLGASKVFVRSQGPETLLVISLTPVYYYIGQRHIRGLDRAGWTFWGTSTELRFMLLSCDYKAALMNLRLLFIWTLK